MKYVLVLYMVQAIEDKGRSFNRIKRGGNCLKLYTYVPCLKILHNEFQYIFVESKSFFSNGQSIFEYCSVLEKARWAKDPVLQYTVSSSEI